MKLGKKRCAGITGSPCPDKAWFQRKGRKVRCEDCQAAYRSQYHMAYNLRYRRNNKQDHRTKNESHKSPRVEASLTKARQSPVEIQNPKAATKLVNAMINAAS